MNRILIFIIFLSQTVGALEVDEKLTLRILRTSSSKKTVLINRGLEDGLAEGDHAKFYQTSGIVARGVLVKASPSRSIWSVYRAIDPEQLNLDRVLNLKISTPVKITKDRSKMLSPENTPDGAQIALAPGADDLPKELTEGDRQDLAALGPGGPSMSVADIPGVSKDKTLEVWGLVHFNGMTSSSDRGEEGSSSGSASTLDFSVGFEKYFNDPQSWFHRISVFGLFHSSKRDFQTLEGTSVGLTAIEYGAGLNYHFLANPFAYNQLIGFFTFSTGIGKSEEVLTVNTASSTEESQPFSGSSSFMAVGIGLKYFTAKGFGLRTLLDYYTRTEKYSISEGTSDFSKKISGPRLQVGLAFRW